MAIDTGMYAMPQFRVALAPETTLGTANTTTMQLINIDGYPSVSRNVERMLDIRSGVGTTPKKADVYVNQQGQEKVYSFSGYVDSSVVITSGTLTNNIWYQLVYYEAGDNFVNVGAASHSHGTVFKSTGTTPTTWTNGSKLRPLTIGMLLLENCIGVIPGASPLSYDVAGNFTTVECAHGDTDTTMTGAFTLALISPEGNNTIIQPGCFVRSVRLYADVGSEGGRFKFDAELVSRHNISGSQAVPGSMIAYPTTSYRTIYNLSGANSNIGISIYWPVLNKFEIIINNNLRFFGFDQDGDPQTIGRGFPEMEVTGLFGIKYDSETAVLISKQYDENNLDVIIYTGASWAASTFGIKGLYGQISDNFDPGDVENGAFIDLPIKFMAHTSGDVIQIVP